MTASWSGFVTEFLAADPGAIVAALAAVDARTYRHNEPQQMRAWDIEIAILRTSLTAAPMDARLVLEFDLRRLGRRIDAVLVTSAAVIVMEFKVGATSYDRAALMQIDDYALDLQDFHAGSRGWPIVPVLVATLAPSVRADPALSLAGVQLPYSTNARDLGGVLADVLRCVPRALQPLDVAAWEYAPYRPVPGIIDAACALYGRHGVADILAAGADTTNLSATTDSVLGIIEMARRTGTRHAVFVTGTPGAGKTLCGLNVVFGASADPARTGAVFLTGNPTLVHVLREALARDAVARFNADFRAARQRMSAAIQGLPRFRDHHVDTRDPPPEHVIVVDEAQRAWSRDHAIRKSVARRVPLTDSEPALLLDVMATAPDWSVLVGLVGGGQEIHDGEGGLTEWGTALSTRPIWHVHAAHPAATDPRRRLPTRHVEVETLHLSNATRSVRHPFVDRWVDALLAGDTAGAAAIAADPPIPFRLTRDLPVLRTALREAARGLRRAGLVASSGARRLRADGLGVELDHTDPQAVERWFLDRWPDVRASDALETVATEFSIQGLELDIVGLCWGGDLLPAREGWTAQRFAGTAWRKTRHPERTANRTNAYRVLLTRARLETVIWVPCGAHVDPTRAPSTFDAVADRLLAAGVRPL